MNISHPAFALVMLACFALSQQARATCQEGCLTNQNTVLGEDALLNNVGITNTAIGFNALYSNTFGGANTANGAFALYFNSSGGANTANGVYALYNNTIGNDNVASGFHALYANTGSDNIALGAFAGSNVTTGSHNIDIGNFGLAGDFKTIRIGRAETQRKTFIAGISGVTVASGVGVIVGSDGQLGTVVSSERFKEAIKPMAKTSEAILSLKPMMFRYKHDLDPQGIPQFGLVAEDVEKVNPDLVARDEQGKPYSVRYEAVNAMLLNEFLKEHRRNDQQQSKIEQQEAKIARQQKQIETLTAGLQKVSAQLEIMKPRPQTVSR